MRKILVAVVLLMLLAGGGAGAYFFYFSKSAEASVAAGDEVVEGHEKAQKGKHASKDGHGASSYEFVELDPLILPIVDKNGVTQVVSLVIVLEVPDATAAREAEALSPRLKDAYIQDMYGALNKHAALKGGVIQVDYIKKRLNKVSAEVLGEDKVNSVLLQVVQQRPI
jgi:flagellar FliL protein